MNTNAFMYVDLPCVVCGNNNSFEEVYCQNFSPEYLTPDTFSARRTTEHWHYRIVKCNNCSQVFSSPILEPTFIESLYSRSNQNYDLEIENICRSYLKPIVSYLPMLSPRDSCLEIGCGSGFFLEKLFNLGFKNLVGIEPSSLAVAKAPQSIYSKLINAVFENVEFGTETFKLICCFHTLDHVFNPRVFISRCHSITTSDALLYFIVHDQNALQARLLGERSPIYDVEHVYLFNQKTLKELFISNGFEVLTIAPLWNRYSLEYWFRMFPLLSSFKQTVISFLKYSLLAKIPITIPAGNIYIIARRI